MTRKMFTMRFEDSELEELDTLSEEKKASIAYLIRYALNYTYGIKIAQVKHGGKRRNQTGRPRKKTAE